MQGAIRRQWQRPCQETQRRSGGSAAAECRSYSVTGPKGHAALAKVLERHGIDAQPAHRPFSLGEADELAMLGHRAGFSGIEVDAVVKVMRFESPGDFVRILAAGAPSTRHALAKVSESQRRQIIADVDAELQPYVDSGGLGLPYASHFLSAHA